MLNPAALSCARNDRIDMPSVVAPCVTSNGREGVNVHIRDRGLDAAANGEIGLTGVIRMDAALKAYLGGASLPRLSRAPDDFFKGEVIGLAA